MSIFLKNRFLLTFFFLAGTVHAAFVQGRDLCVVSHLDSKFQKAQKNKKQYLKKLLKFQTKYRKHIRFFFPKRTSVLFQEMLKKCNVRQVRLERIWGKMRWIYGMRYPQFFSDPLLIFKYVLRNPSAIGFVQCDAFPKLLEKTKVLVRIRFPNK